MGKLVETIKVYEENDYSKFVKDPKYNRQVRKDSEFKQLVADIKEHGQTNCIKVVKENGVFVIADGQRRYEALKVCLLPIKYCITDNESVIRAVKADLFKVKQIQEDFVSMGYHQNIKFFSTIHELIHNKDIKANATNLIEVVGTYVVNKKKSLYSNSTFMKAIKNDPIETFKKLNVKVSTQDLSAINEFLNLTNEVSGTLEKKRCGVNLNKELLSVHLGLNPDIHVSLEEISTFLKKGKFTQSSLKGMLRTTNANGEIKTILKLIQKSIVTNELTKATKAKNKSKKVA